MNPARSIARGAAHRLTEAGQPDAELEVEFALADSDFPKANQYVDPIALGGLIVGVATLAWQVYNDLKQARRKPTKEAVERQVGDRLRDAGYPTDADSRRVVDAVAEETVRYGDDEASR